MTYFPHAYLRERSRCMGRAHGGLVLLRCGRWCRCAELFRRRTARRSARPSPCADFDADAKRMWVHPSAKGSFTYCFALSSRRASTRAAASQKWAWSAPPSLWACAAAASAWTRGTLRRAARLRRSKSAPRSFFSRTYKGCCASTFLPLCASFLRAFTHSLPNAPFSRNSPAVCSRMGQSAYLRLPSLVDRTGQH